MPKTFYTERDIANLAQQGVTSLDINDDVVLTDMARDEALKRGIRLARVRPARPEDAAAAVAQAELIHRVKAAVIARLPRGQVDDAVLDAVVTRVVKAQQ